MQIHNENFELLISAEEIRNRILTLTVVLNIKYANQNPVFVIILNGAFIFAADIVKQFNGDCETVFVRVKSYIGTNSGEISEFSGFNTDLRGRHIIFLEDIIDTGKTVHYLLQEVNKLKPASVSIVSLLQKKIQRANGINADLTGFEIPDVFVVGYGLDYAEKGRNLNGIWKMKL